MESFLQQLQQEGKRDSWGKFTLAPDRAEFHLQKNLKLEPHYLLLNWLRMSQLLQADSVHFRSYTDKDLFTMELLFKEESQHHLATERLESYLKSDRPPEMGDLWHFFRTGAHYSGAHEVTVHLPSESEGKVRYSKDLKLQKEWYKRELSTTLAHNAILFELSIDKKQPFRNRLDLLVPFLEQRAFLHRSKIWLNEQPFQPTLHLTCTKKWADYTPQANLILSQNWTELPSFSLQKIQTISPQKKRPTFEAETTFTKISQAHLTLELPFDPQLPLAYLLVIPFLPERSCLNPYRDGVLLEPVKNYSHPFCFHHQLFLEDPLLKTDLSDYRVIQEEVLQNSLHSVALQLKKHQQEIQKELASGQQKWIKSLDQSQLSLTSKQQLHYFALEQSQRLAMFLSQATS